MANVYGVTEKGFIPKPIEDIVDSLNKRFTGKFGATFDVSPESPDGQVIGIIAKEISDCWQTAESSFNAYRPGANGGVPLDNICELTRTKRYVNRPTRVTVVLGGSSGTLVPAGSIVSDGNLDFATENDVTIPGDVTASCTKPGEFYIAPNTVTKIKTTKPNWTSVNNPEEGLTGVDYEDDPSLRARRDKTTVSDGSATVEAIYSALSSLDLSYVRIRDNDTGSPIGAQPSGTIFVVVDGGTTNEIARAIFEKKAAGIPTFGTTVVPVKDSRGYSRDIKFSRSSDSNVFIKGTFKRLPGANLSSNDVAITLQEAAMEYVNSLSPGEPLVWSYLFNPLLRAGGQIQIDSLFIGLSANPTGTATLVMDIDKRARTVKANVSFTESP